MTRSYDQSCPAARALDVVGGRWSLLIVRELLLGPRRYTDLVTGLPGIGPNVLAERLRALRKAGILSQVKLPPPASSAVYELTELGTAMRPVLDELTRWGMRLPTSPRPGDTFRLSWVLGCLRASFRPEEASGVRETYEFRVDGDTFHLRVDDGVLDIQNGSATDPVCAITTDLGSFLAIGARLVDIEDAVARGLARLEGELPAAARVVAILGAHPEATGGRHGIVGAVGATFRPTTLSAYARRTSSWSATWSSMLASTTGPSRWTSAPPRTPSRRSSPTWAPFFSWVWAPCRWRTRSAPRSSRSAATRRRGCAWRTPSAWSAPTARLPLPDPRTHDATTAGPGGSNPPGPAVQVRTNKARTANDTYDR